MKILHIITGLNQGGAEAVLCRLVKSTVSNLDIKNYVISLTPKGYYEQKILELGVEVYTLDVRNLIKFIFKFNKLITKIDPDIIQTWMYHADLIGGGVSKILGYKNIIWGIRHSSLEGDKLTTKLIAKVNAALSYFVPKKIACCSIKAKDMHVGIGYEKERFVIISNGYDLTRFDVDLELRSKTRAKFKIQEKSILLGMVARWNKQKDHGNLLKAIKILKEKNLDFKLILVGPQINEDNNDLLSIIEKNGIKEDILLLGPQDNVSAIMNALDIHILSSYAEAFPNVVAEAMACGTPCVTTDVGDAGLIVGNSDWVVPAKSPEKLADAIFNAIETIKKEGRDIVGERCRQRIEENFSLKKMVDSYINLWKEALDNQDHKK